VHPALAFLPPVRAREDPTLGSSPDRARSPVNRLLREVSRPKRACARRTAVDRRAAQALTSALVGRPCPPTGRLRAAADDPGPHRGASDGAGRLASAPAGRRRAPRVPAKRRPRPSAGVARFPGASAAQPRPRRSIISAAAADGFSATGMPKPARIACFSAADSPPGPSSFTIAPAWPICLPAGASKPAM
jgi:hypothetical protein